MNLKSLNLILFILLSFYMKAQNGVSITNACGFNIQTSSYAFDISVGEPFIYTLEDSFSMFNCGYIQPNFDAINAITFVQNIDQPKIFPNPFSNVLNVQTELNNLNCCIYDILGRQVFEGKCTQVLDLGFLNDGVYFLSISDKYHQVFTNIKICKSN